ncbi:protein cereblon isoform X1 [Frankliniella occidentalis]|uniref:Protein cereblon n=1 Tax=Frankliniella occidentalis TaxID=133901 RepID=A0A6J1SVY0_FRAOC|nr:protein cereblon isoform X1 [Frankliniella occidentalis]XP_052126291.1 protein cereblon isoform X1 [Frankliniella occidentalis]
MEGDDDRSSDDSWSADFEVDPVEAQLDEFWEPARDESETTAPLSNAFDVSEQTFDPTLPMQHSYLGTDLTVLHGRTLLDDDEGSSYWLPLLPQIDVVLVPGQTLPLSVSNSEHQHTLQMIKRALDGNKIFATICMLRHENMTDLYYADVGTTAEIYEVHSGGENNSMKIKAIGRQRFQLLETKPDSEGFFPLARVKVLPEITLPNPMSENAFQCLDRYRTNVNDEEKALKRRHSLRSSDSLTSAWPLWIYEQYDPQVLVKRMKRVLSTYTAASQIPSDPIELSFWVARSLPVSDAVRLIPLRMNSAIQRLRWELNTLEKPSILCCRNCNQTIANQQDVFSMSAEGLQGTYVNPHGFVHDTITIRKANGIVLQNQPPSTEFSWFPGYGWTIAACSQCQRHIGWRFTATDSQTRPSKFWGLCRRSLNSKSVKELFPKE